MAKFDVEIPHALPIADVRTRLEKARSKLEQEYGATCTWDGEDRMRVARKGLDAVVSIHPDKLRVDCQLGMLMSAVSGSIKSGITKQLTDLLSAPSS